MCSQLQLVLKNSINIRFQICEKQFTLTERRSATDSFDFAFLYLPMSHLTLLTSLRKHAWCSSYMIWSGLWSSGSSPLPSWTNALFLAEKLMTVRGLSRPEKSKEEAFAALPVEGVAVFSMRTTESTEAYEDSDSLSMSAAFSALIL